MAEADAEFAQEYARRAAEEFARGVRRVADELRHLADNVERRATPGPSLRTLRPDFGGALYDVLHDVTTGLSNSGIELLARRAVEADAAALDAQRLLTPAGGGS